MFWRKSKSEAAEAAKLVDAAKLQEAAQVEAARAESAAKAEARAEAARAEAAKADLLRAQSVEAERAAARKTTVAAPAVAAPTFNSAKPARPDLAPPPALKPVASSTPVAAPSVAAAPPTTSATVTRLVAPKNAKSWQTAARALGEVMSVLQHSKRFRSVPLGDLDWMIIPALWVGQYKLGKDVRATDPNGPPTAVIFWARVSPEVDQRLSQNPSAPIKLAPEEWISGDIVWVVEAAGPEPLVQEMLRQLSEDIVNGPIKVRTIGANGSATVATITAKPREPERTNGAALR